MNGKCVFQHFGGHRQVKRVPFVYIYMRTRCLRITFSLLFMVFKRPSYTYTNPIDFIYADDRKDTSYALFSVLYSLSVNVCFHAKSTNVFCFWFCWCSFFVLWVCFFIEKWKGQRWLVGTTKRIFESLQWAYAWQISFNSDFTTLRINIDKKWNRIKICAELVCCIVTACSIKIYIYYIHSLLVYNVSCFYAFHDWFDGHRTHTRNDSVLVLIDINFQYYYSI